MTSNIAFRWRLRRRRIARINEFFKENFPKKPKVMRDLYFASDYAFLLIFVIVYAGIMYFGWGYIPKQALSGIGAFLAILWAVLVVTLRITIRADYYKYVLRKRRKKNKN